MPTENEIRVMEILNAIEVPAAAGPAIEGRGNDAVTVLCEAALGTYAGIRFNVRTNAVFLLGALTHPQAMETVQLLIVDPDPDVSVHAMRAAGRQKNSAAVAQLDALLKRRDLPPLLAAEAVDALSAIDSREAQSVLKTYAAASPDEYPHRGSVVVRHSLKE